MITSKTDQRTMSLVGLSTDTKPVNVSWLGNGSTFLEMDTDKVYIYDEKNKVWREL